MIVMRDDYGDPLEIQGYAAVFGARSDPLDERAGRRETIVPGAFAPSEFRNVVARFGHTARGEVLNGAKVTLRQDEFGLAFAISAIPATVYSAGLISSVANHATAGCSFMADLDGAFIDHAGERIFAVTRARNLVDIAISAAGLYPMAGCWLAHHAELPPRLAALRAAWEDYA